MSEDRDFTLAELVAHYREELAHYRAAQQAAWGRLVTVGMDPATSHEAYTRAWEWEHTCGLGAKIAHARLDAAKAVCRAAGVPFPE